MMGDHCHPHLPPAVVDSVQGVLDSDHEQPIPCAKNAASLHDAQHSHAVNNLNSFLPNVPNSTPSQLGDAQTTQEEPPVTCSSCSVNDTESVALMQTQLCGANATSTLNHACPETPLFLVTHL